MNALLVIGLVLFACLVTWIYVLFMLNTVGGQANRHENILEPNAENVLERCYQLFDEGLHSELQRFAQRELSKNYGDIELRRILAESLMATGNCEMAIMHYEAILAINSNDEKTQEFLAQYYLEHGPKSRAIELYEQIFAQDSTNLQSVEILAKSYEEVQNYPKAIQMYTMLLDAEIEEEKIIELKYILADMYVKVEDYSKAYDEYRYIYNTNPDNLEIAVILAELAYKNKYWKECLRYYESIVETVGDDYEILQKIVQLHTILENWHETIEIYKKIIQIEGVESPNYLYHQNEMCNAMLKCGFSIQAIKLLKDLIMQYPKETSFIFTLAQAYTQNSDFQAGIDTYSKLLDVLPQGQSELIMKYIANSICQWAQKLFDEGDYEHAFEKFYDALKIDEENDMVYFQLGKCNYYIKSFQDAIAHFKRAIVIKPQNSQYYFALGCAYDETGAVKNARAAFHDAINIDPNNIKARIAYAISLTKELEYAQSIEQFNEVLKYIPNNADTLYNLALAYEMVGDYERAIKFYRQAIDADNNHKEAKYNLYLLTEEEYRGLTQEEKEAQNAQIEVQNTQEAQKIDDSGIDIEDFKQYL